MSPAPKAPWFVPPQPWNEEEWADPVEQEALVAREHQQEIAHGETPEEKLWEIEHALVSRFGVIRRNALEIGALYAQARRLLKREGKFTEWVERIRKERRGLSLQAARNHIRLYEHCHGRPELVDLIPLTKLQRICAPSFPDTLREILFKAGRCDPEVRDLVKLANEFNKADQAGREKLRHRLEQQVGALDDEKVYRELKRIKGDLRRRVEESGRALMRLKQYPGSAKHSQRIQQAIDAVLNLERALEQTHTKCASTSGVRVGVAE